MKLFPKPGMQAWVLCSDQGLSVVPWFQPNQGFKCGSVVPTRDSSVWDLGSNQGLKRGSLVATRDSSMGPLFRPRNVGPMFIPGDSSVGPLFRPESGP